MPLTIGGANGCDDDSTPERASGIPEVLRQPKLLSGKPDCGPRWRFPAHLKPRSDERLRGDARSDRGRSPVTAVDTGAAPAPLRSRNMVTCTRSEERRVGKECRSRWS